MPKFNKQGPRFRATNKIDEKIRRMNVKVAAPTRGGRATKKSKKGKGAGKVKAPEPLAPHFNGYPTKDLVTAKLDGVAHSKLGDGDHQQKPALYAGHTPGPLHL